MEGSAYFSSAGKSGLLKNVGNVESNSTLRQVGKCRNLSVRFALRDSQINKETPNTKASKKNFILACFCVTKLQK